MHEFNKENDYYKIAKSLLNEFPIEKKVSGKKLASVLKKQMRVVTEVYKNAYSLSEENTSSFLTWLTENFYILEDIFAKSCKNIRKLKNLKGSTHSFPQYYLVAKKFINLQDDIFNEEIVNSFIKALDSDKKNRSTYNDLFSLDLMLRSALLSVSYELCIQCKNNTYSKSIESNAKKLSQILSSLKYLSYHSFNESIEKCETEEILLKDPARIYKKLTDETKSFYRFQVSRLAEKAKMNEANFANKIVAECEQKIAQKDRHIGSLLLPKPKNGNMYLATLFLFLFIFAFLSSFFTPFAILLLFPFWEIAKQLTDFIFSAFAKPIIIPKINVKELAPENSTLVVITTLLCGEKNDKMIFERLEKMFVSNSGNNIYFGLLCDLCDSTTKNNSKDEEIIKYSEDRINYLNSKYGNFFFLFIRERSYSKSEKKFMGYERKRGAVIELCKFLKNQETHFDLLQKSLSENSKIFSKIKYVITLDSDTNLYINSAKTMVGCMLHPQNKPEIDFEKKIVTSGYGIMQPRISTELFAASRTPFSRIMCGIGGIDVYSSASFDIYQNLFGEGIFCGKGIFDVDAFYETVVKAEEFSDDYILSHDALEGAKLRCGLISDIELCDGFPKNEISYLKRQHRWTRGDVQNLYYLKNSVIGKNGKKVKNYISTMSKFKIFDNFRRNLVCVFAFISIIVSMFLNNSAAIFIVFSACFYLALPFLIESIMLIFKFGIKSAARQFFSKGVSTSIWQNLLRFLLSLIMLPKCAITNINATTKSLYRMFVSKSNLLEWTTAATAENSKSGTLWYFIQKNITEAVIGFLLFLFAPIGITKLIGFLWFMLPLVAYFTSIEIKDDDKSPSEKEQMRLLGYAKDIWQFFDENITYKDNYLPPDNIQLFPFESVAHRTSPTNIGLYLICIISARDFGFIKSIDLYKRLSNTLMTIEKLEKYKGHLYNWYNTKDLSVLQPKYISSVDSGNFLASLICVKEGILDYISECPSLLDIVKNLSILIENTDLSVIYNTKRNLFSIGLSEENGVFQMDDGAYDLFMSEARTLSYIAVAKRKVPKKHWQSLSRSLIASNGYIGLASWTGSAFEYFMPPLFLPNYKSSLSYEALNFAAEMQKERKAEGIFGISESGFFAFDSEMNYQYKAFGIPKLGLKKGLDKEMVISPYSSFLMMCIDVRAALVNLRKLYLHGMYGKYGFYEAIDFTETRVNSKNGAFIKSYMSHHLGMSLISLSNANFDNIMQKRFMHDPTMNAGRELLEEKIPVDAVIRKLHLKYDIPQTQSRAAITSGKIYSNFSLYAPNVFIKSDGRTTIILSSSGHTAFFASGKTLNLCDFNKYESINSFYQFININGECFSLSPLPFVNPEKTTFTAVNSQGIFSRNAEFELNGEEYSAKQNFTISRKNSSIIRILTTLEAPFKSDEFQEKFETAFSLLPILSKLSDYNSHPAFSALFVSTEYDEDEKILYFRRRMRNISDDEQILALALLSSNSKFSFDTREEDTFKIPKNSDSFKTLFAHKELMNTGACISPFCLIKTNFEKSHGHFESELLISFGQEKSGVRDNILNARKEAFEESIKSLEEISLQLSLSTGYFQKANKKADLSFENQLLSGVFFQDHNGNLESFKKSDLWENGISGDLPIILIVLGSAYLAPSLENYIRAYKLLMLKNVKFDIVILFKEGEKYFRPHENAVKDLISKCSCDGFLQKKNGGIFIIEQNSSNSSKALFAFASKRIDIYSEKSIEEKETISIKSPKIPNVIPNKDILENFQEKSFKVISGEFINSDFIISKSNPPKLPFSNVLTGRYISTLVTQNSLGYTWVTNSQEKRICEFSNSVYEDLQGERLLLFVDDKIYNLCSISSIVKVSQRIAFYEGKIFGTKFTVSVFVTDKISAKIITVSFGELLNKLENSKLFLVLSPIMGKNLNEHRLVSYQQEENKILFKNAFSENFCDFTGFVTLCRKNSNPIFCFSKEELFFETIPESKNLAALGVNLSESRKTIFAIGAYKTDTKTKDFTFSSLENNLSELFENTEKYNKSLIPKIAIDFSANAESIIKKALFPLYNYWLPYQNTACRLIARSGFYQSGGAYGFRDQLQDCMCSMYAKSDFAKSQIIRAAAHQFIDGDVLHWWHNTTDGVSFHKGVRTRCSDDYLWIVYSLCEYVKFTGHNELCDVSVRYIAGESLHEGQNEKYIQTHKSDIYESVFLHCKRAVERSLLLLGKHGLPLIGSGDWCDGLNNVGKNGNGESIWLAMFLHFVLSEFVKIFKDRFTAIELEKYNIFLNTLSENTNKYGYDENGNYYIRAYYDDGEKLGALENEECKIDLLPQAFSVISEIAKNYPERQNSSIKNAYKYLFDKEYKIFKLFSPPFKNSKKDEGYIKGYVAGIRENGGQYTHAAIWGALGLIKEYKNLFDQHKFEESKEIYSYSNEAIKSLLPSLRTSKYYDFLPIRENYKTEPYVLTGDVYANSSHMARGGWSWYSGSSGWLYRILTNEVFGVNLQNTEKEFTFFAEINRPLPLSEELDGMTLKISLNERNIKVHYILSNEGFLVLNGKKVENNHVNLPIGEHTISYYFKKFL